MSLFGFFFKTPGGGPPCPGVGLGGGGGTPQKIGPSKGLSPKTNLLAAWTGGVFQMKNGLVPINSPMGLLTVG